MPGPKLAHSKTAGHAPSNLIDGNLGINELEDKLFWLHSDGTTKSAILSKVGVHEFFGYGTDGDVVVNGAVTLTKDMHYNDLTIQAGAAIDTAGYRIYVGGTLDLAAAPAGAIYRNGPNGSNAVTWTPGAAGATLAATTRLGGSAGTPHTGGSSDQGVAVNDGPAQGGSGGGSGRGGAGAGRNKAVAAASTPTHPYGRYGQVLSGADFALIDGGLAGQPGTGGESNGGTHGAGGGSAVGGGVIVIVARTIQRGANNTAAVIQCKGGKGGNGSAGSDDGSGGGGAGGGGGGWVVVVFQYLTGSGGANFIDVSGGAGGDGHDTGVTGGGSADTGRVDLYDLGAGQLRQTIPVAGAMPAGSTGHAANTKQVSLA